MIEINFSCLQDNSENITIGKLVEMETELMEVENGKY